MASPIILHQAQQESEHYTVTLWTLSMYPVFAEHVKDMFSSVRANHRMSPSKISIDGNHCVSSVQYIDALIEDNESSLW